MFASLMTAVLALNPTVPQEPAQEPAQEAQAPPMAEVAGFLPRGITSFGATEHEGWIFVLGGYFGQPHEYSREGQSASFLRLNPLDLRDQHLLSDTEPVQSVELVSHASGLIRIGGMRAENGAGEESRLRSIDLVQRYDPGTGQWSALAPLPMPLSSHRAAVLGDQLFVVGGWSMTPGQKPRWNERLWSLDLANPEAQWQSVEAPFRRRALAAAAVSGQLVVLGGMNGDGKLSRSVHTFDPTEGVWGQGPDYPQWAFGLAAHSEGARVLASGRDGGVFAWEPGTEDWRPVGRWAMGRFFHEIVPLPSGDLLALGGIGGMDSSDRLRTVERLALRGHAERTITRWSVPSPMASKNRQGVFLKDGSLYLFGGNNSLGQHDFEPENFESANWRLDLGSLRWQRLRAYPVARQTIQAVVSNEGDTGFAVGGFGMGESGAQTQATSFLYDFEFDTWSSKGPALPVARSQFGLVRREGQLWVFGGLNYDPGRPEDDEFQHLTEVLQWSEGMSEFQSTGIHLPEPRRAFAGARLGDTYVLVGGMKEDFALVESVHAFDWSTQEWQTWPAPNKPRLSATLLPLRGELYLVAGSSRQANGRLGPDRSIERYIPSERRWETVVEDVGMDTKHAHAFVWNEAILLFSTHQKGAARAEIALIAVPEPQEVPHDSASSVR